MKDYLSQFFLSQMYLLRLIPEGRLKFFLRKIIIRLYDSLPNSFAVNKNDIVVQLGCWRTETMENWSKLVGKKGKVITVEADPENFRILEIEKKRRELENVILINKGIWHSKGTARLQVSTLSKRNKLKDADAYTPKNPDSNYDEIKVIPVDSLDHILEELNIRKVDHIQMEVSGAEFEALKGMPKTLSQKGIRIHIRSILIQKSTDKPLYEIIEKSLKDLGLIVYKNKKEKNQDGSNLYAVRF